MGAPHPREVYRPASAPHPQSCPLCGQGRDELEHTVTCKATQPAVAKWKRALEAAGLELNVKYVLEPPDAVLLPTLQLVQELHRLRHEAGAA